MKKIALNVSIVIIIVGITILGVKLLTNDRIVYVRTGIVLEKYKGMIETNNKFSKEVEIVRANIDSLKKKYERVKSQENIVRNKQEWEYSLKEIESEYESYSRVSDEKIQQRQMEMSDAVLVEINDFIINYGKQHHYKYILGTTNDGSILYGNEEDDITNVIVDAINKKYEESHK